MPTAVKKNGGEGNERVLEAFVNVRKDFFADLRVDDGPSIRFCNEKSRLRN
jgi:hypothetical protein